MQEAARWRGAFCILLKRRRRTHALCRGDLLALVGFDLGEDVGQNYASTALETAIKRSSRPSASPVSIDLAASAAPCLRSCVLPATMSAAAAFRIATSRKALGFPLRTSSSAFALCSASPPRSASGFERGKPASSGVTSNVRIWL